ncbi:hypothetical protein ACPZ19_38580 [Amycolatopsis lurida]
MAYRSFYGAMFTGSCGYALTTVLNDLLIPFNERFAPQIADTRLPPGLAHDLTVFITGGSATVFSAWLIEGDDPSIRMRSPTS